MVFIPDKVCPAPVMQARSYSATMELYLEALIPVGTWRFDDRQPRISDSVDLKSNSRSCFSVAHFH